jgi:outer membrane murein-binding lipoprotein Lpp
MWSVNKELKSLALFIVAVIGTTVYLAGCSTTRPQDQILSVREGDAGQISHVRRLLRAACERLKAVNAGAPNSAELMVQAKDLTVSAVQKWEQFLNACDGRAPSDYGEHPNWDAATRGLASGMAEMLKRIEESDAANAFETCGATCGKFVVLNEQARVRCTSDVLFHFRKAAKPLAEPVAKGNLDAVLAKVGQLTEIRDKAMIEPVGGTGTPAQKAQALEAFSQSVDAFAATVTRGDRAALDAQYRKMMSAMEKAYDLFL